jgi:hypothetical protein
MLKDPKNNGSQNIPTVLIVSGFLYLIAIALLTIIYSFRVENMAGEQIPFIVELRDSCDEADIFRIEQLISKSDYCEAKSLQFIPKEEAAKKILGNDLKKEEMEVFDENLLPNIIEFQLKSNYASKANKIISDLKKQPAVADVLSNKLVTAKFNINLQRIRLIASFLLIFFIFVALSIICKSNRINSLSDTNTGKTDFAAKMFKNNIRTAIFSGLFCFAALLLTFVSIGKQFDSSAFSGSTLNFFIVCAAVFILGIMLFTAATKITTIQNFKLKQR